MASGFKKETYIYFFFSLKSPGKRTLSRFSNRAPMKRGACLHGILHTSQKPHLSDSPVKEPALKVLFTESLTEPSFIHLSKSPTYEPPHIPGSPPSCHVKRTYNLAACNGTLLSHLAFNC
jgi:hypothetical protein